MRKRLYEILDLLLARAEFGFGYRVLLRELRLRDLQELFTITLKRVAGDGLERFLEANFGVLDDGELVFVCLLLLSHRCSRLFKLQR